MFISNSAIHNSNKNVNLIFIFFMLKGVACQKAVIVIYNPTKLYAAKKGRTRRLRFQIPFNCVQPYNINKILCLICPLTENDLTENDISQSILAKSFDTSAPEAN